MNELHLLHVISTLTNLSFWCIHSLCPLTSTDGDLGSGFAQTLWSLGHKLRCPNLVLSPTVIFPCISMYFPWQMYICFFHLISFFFGAISQTINVRDFFFFQSAYYPNLYQRPSCLQLQQWSRVGCFLMSCISKKVRFNLCVRSVSLKSVTFYHLRDRLVPFLAPVQ